jgi:Cu-Zn family superoxide dismutase
MKASYLTTAVLVALIAMARTVSGALATSPTTVSRAVVVLTPTEANSVSGTVTFTKTITGVRIVADVTGLTPGFHGLQIREFGNCTARDASSAGDIFNPSRMSHGPLDSPFRQAGELGNLLADASGRAHYDRVDTVILLEGINSIVGRAVTVHQRPDDLRSQPTGNVGPAVACGVIGIASQ